MTESIFIACALDESNQPAKTFVCQRENGIGRIRGYVINGNWIATFDRDGNGQGSAEGSKIMWAGTRPTHISGYTALIEWFEREIFPTLQTPVPQRRAQA